MSQRGTMGSERSAIAVHDRVLAGFDGSTGSAAAVQWAAREAQLRGSMLQVVMGRAVPDAVDFSGIGARQRTSLQTVAQRIEEAYPVLRLDVHATVGDPRDALVGYAASADLLVVGSHESGAARRLLYGSVARTAARRSPCPAVVVKGARASQPIRRIAVGVDGSSAAEAALLWAAHEAELHDAEVLVVHGWDRSVWRADAELIVDEAVALCRRHTRATVRGELFDGDGSAALNAASLGAELLAVGSRGRSGFKTIVFGSVALEVAEQSMCPVAVTHPQPRSA